MSKVGYEYFSPKDNNNNFIIGNGNHYIITSSVNGKGNSVTLWPVTNSYPDLRYFTYHSRKMNDNTGVSYCFPLISF